MAKESHKMGEKAKLFRGPKDLRRFKIATVFLGFHIIDFINRVLKVKNDWKMNKYWLPEKISGFCPQFQLGNLESVNNVKKKKF